MSSLFEVNNEVFKLIFVNALEAFGIDCAENVVSNGIPNKANECLVVTYLVPKMAWIN